MMDEKRGAEVLRRHRDGLTAPAAAAMHLSRSLVRDTIVASWRDDRERASRDRAGR